MKKIILAALFLLVSACTACVASPPPLPPLTIPDCLGINIHFSGPENAQVERIAKAGFRFIRMDFNWGTVESKKGQYAPQFYDPLVDSLASRNIRPLFILDYGHGLYDKGFAPRTNEGRAAFATFAAASAAHFKGKGVIWELWNEPNIGFWSPKPSAEDYVKLAKAVYPAMKKADPDSVLIGPALAGWDYAYFEKCCKSGLLECTDAVSLHAYGAAKPEDAVEYYNNIRTIIDKYAPKGRTYPLISCEWGYSEFEKGVSLQQHADYIARMFLINMMNECRISIWYDWRDDDRRPNSPEMEFHFGILYNDFKEKPTYFSAKTLMSELNGYSFARRLESGSDEDYLALFGKWEDYRLAAWTTGKAHTISIPTDAESVTVVSQLGERKLVNVKDGMLDIDLTGSVQYIEPKQPSRRWAIESAWEPGGKLIMKHGVSMALIGSTLNAVQARGTLGISGSGLTGSSAAFRSGKTQISEKYAWDGSPNPHVQVSLVVNGLDKPLVRIIKLNTSDFPYIEVLPPSSSELLIAVRRTNTERAFNGKLSVSDVSGVQLTEDKAAFTLAPGRDMAIVRIKMDSQPKSTFSLACSLLDSKGSVIFKMKAKRYAILNTFEGKPGEDKADFIAAVDSDLNSAKLTYTKAPEGSPIQTCARLDYSLSGGWQFAKILPNSTSISDRPVCMKAWIKGDDASGSSKLRFKDANGEVYQPNYGFMNFKDWRCLEVNLTGISTNHWDGDKDEQVQYPISWESIFAIEGIGQGIAGTLYFGPMMLCYDK